MSKLSWSSEQLSAIETREKNILVSAAAGAGKTTVLVERIRRMIMDEKVPVREFLVLTFTNDAAREMKDRLRESLQDQLRRMEPNDEDREYIKRQIRELETAYITTFHAFGLKVIRRFFYKLGLEPGFGILEPVDAGVLMEEALDILLETEYEELRPEFAAFMDAYSGYRDDGEARGIIKAAYEKLKTIPHFENWLEEKISETERLGELNRDSYLWGLMKDDLRECLDEVGNRYRIIVGMLEMEGLDYLGKKVIDADISKVLEAKALLDEGLSPEETLARLSLILSRPGSRLSAKDEDKEVYAEIQKEITAKKNSIREYIASEITTPYLNQDIHTIMDNVVKTAPYLRTLGELVCELDRIYGELKLEQGALDFDDIEHYCLEALEDDEVSEYYREAISQIFIDEYQDTNLIQEAIIDRIKRANNLFIVGDIKQSIYRFRLAEPSIFANRYEEYSGESTPESIVINLNENHRSKSGIINGVNRVFEKIMDGYDEDAKLKCCIEYEGPLNTEPEFTVLLPPDPEEDSDALDLKAAEMEAHYVADIILDSLGKPFLDSLKNPPVERPLGLDDMVILMRAVSSNVAVYQEVLKSRGIESFVESGENYFSAMEIMGFIDLLRVIDNVRRDIPLVGVLHGETFGFTPAELAEIRIRNREGSFSDSFLALYEGACEKAGEADCESPDEAVEPAMDALEEKVVRAYNRIKGWKEMSRTMSMPNFIWEVLLDSGMYSIVGGFPGGSIRQANLKALCSLAERYSERGRSTLYDFLLYIDSIKSNTIKLPDTNANQRGEGIKIKTVHKSKGLQYPMVILSGLGKQFRFTGKSRFSFHKDIGIGIKLVDRENMWSTNTILERLIARQNRREELDEEIRILYVAMTRARDRLVMVGTQPDEQFSILADMGIIQPTNYVRMIAPIYPYDIEHFSLSDAVFSYESESEKFDKSYAEAIKRRLIFSYPQKLREIKSKYSVSELNREEARGGAGSGSASGSAGGADDAGSNTAGGEYMRPLRTKSLRDEVRKLNAAERGTIYHGILERISFSGSLGKSRDELRAYVSDEVKEMIEKGLFTEDEIKAVDLEKIVGFFESDIGKRAARADSLGMLEKERPFTLKAKVNGLDTLVQGIIDCYFTEDAGGEPRTVLMDYKSSYIDENLPIQDEEERLRKEYSKQLDIYKKALEVAGMWNVCEVYMYLLDIGHSFLL